MTALRTPARAPAARPGAVAGPDLAFDLCDPLSQAAPDGWEECVREHGLHRLWDWRVVHVVAAERRGGVVAGMFRDGGRVVGLATARLHTLGRRHPVGGAADVEHLAFGALPGIALGSGLPRTLHRSGPGPDLLEAGTRALETALRREFGRRLQAVGYRQVYAGELPVFQRGATLAREGKSVAVLAGTFADYDDYLCTLPRSRRKDQRRLARAIEADGSLTVRSTPAADSGIDLDAFGALSADVSRRHHRAAWPPLRIWSPRLFRTLMTLPDVHMLSYTDNRGALVAANALFDHPVAPVLGPWGALPLRDGRRSGLWFDANGRQIRWSVEHGRELVLAGKGADEAKQALGFESYRQWTVVRRLAR